MTADSSSTKLTLELPAALADRLLAISAELGGPQKVIERALLMAPVSPHRALMASPRRTETAISVPISRQELALIREHSASMGMAMGTWARAVLRARLYRQPQLSGDELRANSAVRIQLLRSIDLLRKAVDEGACDEIIACWRQARQTLEGLRSALVGNLIYWSPDE